MPAASATADWKESGLPVTREDFENRERLPSEYRPTDYLRRDLKLILEGYRTVGFRLQAQFHLMKQTNGLQWYNPAVDWDPADHPWVEPGRAHPGRGHSRHGGRAALLQSRQARPPAWERQ
jgi:hypothetical protein